MALHDFKQIVKQIPATRWLVGNTRTRKQSKPQGQLGIQEIGHRAYVGGHWDKIGKLQFDFLVKEGLQPHHYLLDIACGSLRAGVHFIPYLEPGHYLGIEKEEGLIHAAIEKELDRELYRRKKPCLVVSAAFEFDKFQDRPHYALAQSLFTHLPPPLIDTCFKKLRQFIRDDGVFYATFQQTEVEISNPSEPHDHGYFGYTRQQMENFGTRNGWTAEYIGDWNHPRRQKIVRFRPL